MAEKDLGMQSISGFTPEIQDINRQRELAKMLLQKSMQENKGQMIGNRYVGASPWEHIASAYEGYKSNQLLKEADEKQAQLAEKLRQETLRDVGLYQQAIQGTPEQTVYGAGQEGPTMNVTPAVAPDYGKALAIAIGSRSPFVQNMGAQMANEMYKPQKLGEGEQFVKFNPTTGKYETVVQGQPKASTEFGTAVQVLGLDRKPRDQWTQQDLNAIDRKVQQIKQSGAPSVMVNTGKDLSGQIGDIMKTSKADTVAAQKTLNSANKIEQFANSPSFKGVGADVKLQAAQIGDALGIIGKDTQEKINNTRQGVQELGRLAVMASSNKGQGAVSDYERQLYARVAGGDINLTKGELMLVANAAREGANYTIQQHQNQINYMKSNPELKPLVPFYDVPAIAPTAPALTPEFDFKAAAQAEAKRRGLTK